MRFTDQLFIIRNRLFEKRNLILVLVLTIIFLVLFACLTIVQFSIQNKKEISNSVSERTYIVVSPSEEQLNLIKNIKHVELVNSTKYEHSSSVEVPYFDKGKDKGILYIKALLSDYDVDMVKGKSLKNKYELVCSDTFYPYEYIDKIDRNLFLSPDKFLNHSFSITSGNEDLNQKEISLTIVGTYKNKYEEEANTCYTDIETYDEIVSKYNGRFESYDDYGNLISIQYNEYKDYLIRIEEKENISSVLSSLQAQNIKYYKRKVLDSGFLDTLFFIPLFIAIIVILLTLSILYSFISKKIRNRRAYIGILKAIGYDNKTVLSLNRNENIIIVCISSIVSFILYFIILFSFKYTVLAMLTYYSYILYVPYVLILLFVIVYGIIVTLITKARIKKLNNLPIQTLIEK